MKLKSAAAPFLEYPEGIARWAINLVLVFMLAVQVPVARGADHDKIVGGPDAIKINPDFKPTITLNRANASPILNNILDLTGGGVLSVGIPISLQTQLSAALSQAVSASNRPSVLTPYAGVLSSDESKPVFDSLGSLVTNKATTIGKGNLGLGLSYQHSRFNSFDGERIGKSAEFEKALPAKPVTIVFINDPIFGSNSVSSQITGDTKLQVPETTFTADVVTLAVTYGLIDRLDIGALIPYIFLRNEGKAEFTVHTVVRGALGGGPNQVLLVQTDDGDNHPGFSGKWDDSEEGFGDIILFTKFQILSQAGAVGSTHTTAPIDLAAQLEIKLPTGDDDKFLGTGKTDVALRLLAQRAVLDNVILRGEVGYNRSGLSNDFNTYEYRVGFEWAPSVPLAFSAEVIGSYSHEFHAILDGVVGTKYLFPNDFSIFAGLRFPLNDNGLRYPYAPIIGVEKTFHHPFGKSDMASLPPRDLPEFKPVPSEPAAPATAAAPALPAAKPAPVAAPAQGKVPPGSSAMPSDYVFSAPTGPMPPQTPPLPLPSGRNYPSGQAGSTAGGGGN